MRAGFGDDLLARMCQAQLREQIALRAAGDEDRGFLAENLRSMRLERVDARVFAKDVVANFGRAHRLTHFGRRLGNRVAAKVEAQRRFDALCAGRVRKYGCHGSVLCPATSVAGVDTSFSRSIESG